MCILRRLLAGLAASLMLVVAAQAAEPSGHKTENVILLMTDGLRWQEVFSGAEESLLSVDNGGIKDKELDGVKKTYWRDTPLARREALMPFVWTMVARQGQLFGNREKGSPAQVTNGMKFSYPGYNETLCGFPDPRIDSNDKRPNPNVTVFEWLSRKPAYRGRVAAFGVWDVFPFIFNRERCGFFINAGIEPAEWGSTSPRVALLNRLKVETPWRWGSEPFDAVTFHTAMEYLREKRPRVLFVSLNETDAWGHEGKYDEYLKAAHRVDGYFRELWETLQSLPEYQGKTTVIFSPDHGRGDAPTEWKDHGRKVDRSEYMWIGCLGPDTPPLGERTNVAPVTQSQIAATLAALLGEDYRAAQPQAAAPIADLLGGARN